MSEKHDKSFNRQRSETFDTIIALLDRRIKAVLPPVLLHFNEIAPDDLHAAAEKEVWSLLLHGVRHLKDGAPDGQPGTMTEALSKASLRASALAAALGVRPPQFEPIYFTVDYTTGHEAALFFCHRLAEAAAGDLSKSRQLIQQKIVAEKPETETLKKQMAAAFDVLAETYGRLCHEFKSLLDAVNPPAPAPEQE